MLLGWIVIGHVPPKPERNGAVDVWQGAVNGSSSRRAAPVALRQAGADVEPSSADAIASPRRTPISKHAAAGTPTRDESKRNHAQAGTGLARVDSRRLASSHAFAPIVNPLAPRRLSTAADRLAALPAQRAITTSMPDAAWSPRMLSTSTTTLISSTNCGNVAQ
ncbi:hypothetical protein [Burkholderia glumae]|uniref:hypothetical protein n=1 Tax=Burkholderia glumae TaxID=337 RepID=UPI00157B6B67|nr:hypothetical protein [Burkholderia glumae]